MRLGFWRPRPELGFIRPKQSDGRRIRSNGAGCMGPRAAQAGGARRGTLLAQAQVAAWVRHARAERGGPSWLLRFLGCRE